MALLVAWLPASVARAQQAGDEAATDEASPVSSSGDAVDPALQDPYPVDDLKSPVPAKPDLGLRPTLAPTAPPLRTVVRPKEPQQSAALPLTGLRPALVDRETEARSDYAPQGITVGSFTVNVASTVAIGGTHNSKTGDEGYVRDVTELTGRSNWDANSLDFTFRGALQQSVAGTSETKPEGDVIVNGTFGLTEVDKLTGGLSWTLRDDDDSSGNIHTLSASAGYQRSAGLIGLRTSLAVDRSLYDQLTARDNTVLSGSLRLSLDSGAVIRPFVEAGLFHRLYDDTSDASGYRRSGPGGELKGGIAFDQENLSGELALGYAMATTDDSRLPTMRGMLVEGSTTWAITPLLDLTGTAATSFEPTTVAGASGTITRSGDAQLRYAIAPNIFVYGGGGVSFKDYQGVSQSELTTTVKVGGGYKLTPTAELGLQATHKVVDSSVAHADYNESSVEATLTLRR